MTKADDDKAKRLAQALRDNLRRRKAQARGEDAGPSLSSSTERPGEEEA